VDWLAVTFPQSTHPLDLFPPALGGYPLKDAGQGALGYRVMLRNELGSVVLTEGTANMGLHVIMSGSVLEDVRLLGVTDRDLCHNVGVHKGRISRLDVAVDVLDTSLTRDDLVEQYSVGNVRTKARAAMVLKDLNTPEGTFYIGKRSSMRFFRAYDKGAQVHSEETWLRLELETKKLVAQAVGMTIAKEKNTRAVINRAIVTYVDFPTLPTFSEALAEQDATIPRVPRKMTNTLRWLIEQVVPAAARYDLMHPEQEVQKIVALAWEQEKRRLARTQE